MWESDLGEIKRNLHILLDTDQYLSPIDILRNLRILQCNDERLKFIESNTDHKKALLWMLKCEEKTFKRYQTIQHDRDSSLANETANNDAESIEKIRIMFACTLEEANAIFHQVKLLDLKSFRMNFTFLLENGATLSVLTEYCHLLNMLSGKCRNH